MPPIKIDSESNVVMRHGEYPRYADVPCAGLDWQCIPCTAVVPAVSGLSLSITY